MPVFDLIGRVAGLLAFFQYFNLGPDSQILWATIAVSAELVVRDIRHRDTRALQYNLMAIVLALWMAFRTGQVPS
ncbi:MAG TPA: hypothetical protein VMV69_04575 [Pirellulales bacterium]|nr:hypothetical protein [Pirellulales bacterium]